MRRSIQGFPTPVTLSQPQFFCFVDNGEPQAVLFNRNITQAAYIILYFLVAALKTQKENRGTSF